MASPHSVGHAAGRPIGGAAHMGSMKTHTVAAALMKHLFHFLFSTWLGQVIPDLQMAEDKDSVFIPSLGDWISYVGCLGCCFLGRLQK